MSLGFDEYERRSSLSAMPSSKFQQLFLLLVATIFVLSTLYGALIYLWQQPKERSTLSEGGGTSSVHELLPEKETVIVGADEFSVLPEPNPCVVTGCSREICAEEEVMSVCIWKEEYACYQEHGNCRRQESGKCGWTESAELLSCLSGADNEAVL